MPPFDTNTVDGLKRDNGLQVRELQEKVKMLEEEIKDIRGARDLELMANVTDELFIKLEPNTSALGTQDYVFRVRYKGKIYLIPVHDS